MRTILSVDGGGVKGIIPLACLVRLESLRGKPCRELFDMVAGTSTGAVIAAGIALGVSARGLLALYRDLARQAFQRLPWWQVIANLGNHRYSSRFIAEMLAKMGAAVPLNQLPLDILITGKNVHTTQTDFFVTDNPGNAGRWGQLPLQDAVLASIAAPTYFPAHRAVLRGTEHVWVDGGVGVAGNPCYQVAVEAIHYSAGKYPAGETQLLSFGTGRTPHPINATSANFLQWGLWALSEVLEDSADWQTLITRREYGAAGRVDFRRYQVDLSPDVLADLGVSIPPGMDVTRIEMDSVWAVDLLEEIGRAFADRINFDDPGGLELETTAQWKRLSARR